MGRRGSSSADAHPRCGLRYQALLLAGLVTLGCAFASRADAFVYWANGGIDGTTIGRANNDGTGVDNNFITGAREPCGVAVDAKHIYWGNGIGAHTIGRANLDGSGVKQDFITGLSFPCGVAVNATHIYWENHATGSSDPNLGSIGRAKLDGTDVQRPLFGNQGNIVNNPCGTAVGGEFVYWANAGSVPTSIGRSLIPDPLPVGSFVNSAGVFGVCWPSVTSSHLYWSVFNLGIARVPLDDPAAELGVVTGASATGGTAIHASRIYWANSVEGTISRANLDGSSPDSAFITGATSPRGLTVDSGAPGAGGNCNDLALGEATRNKRKGTAKLSAEVPCAGALELGGKGLKPVAKQAPGAGEVELPVKTKGKTKKKLRRKGKAKVEAEVTFTPNGGTPTTEDAKVKLVKK